jgi:hypothetical protein
MCPLITEFRDEKHSLVHADTASLAQKAIAPTSCRHAPASEKNGGRHSSEYATVIALWRR